MDWSVTYIDLDTIERPCDGPCLVDRWWVVHPEKGAAMFGESPQCNTDMRLVDRIIASRYPGHYSQKIRVAYLGSVLGRSA